MKFNVVVMLANGPVVTQPPPAPCGIVSSGPSWIDTLPLGIPSPDIEYSLPSKIAAEVRLPASAAL